MVILKIFTYMCLLKSKKSYYLTLIFYPNKTFMLIILLYAFNFKRYVQCRFYTLLILSLLQYIFGGSSD